MLGPVARVERTPIGRLGHSGATHERLQVQLQNGDRLALVLKRTQLSDDWTAFASGDGLGREVQLLRTSALGAVWDAFANPYVACAVEPDQIGLLMDDLSGHIWPDRVGVSAQRPILEPEEDAVLGALGRLHARYWQSEALTLPWLLQPPIRFNLMGPHASWRERLPHGHQISRGWAAALSHLPGPVAELLTTPPEQLFRRYADLPRTLLHGDAKVPNFALLPDGRVAALDWAWVGVGPPTIEVGWYLAINGGRLARPRDAVLGRYRQLLEAELRTALSNDLWDRLVGIGVLCGAVMLLWEKALALEEAPSPRIAAEWQWWVDALVRLS